ncbi:GNAT family acetyltransferase [Demequina aurantiaca]|uniref:GNAT family acetyltransferase n=1 Tax=Demequina aurantiaca TaxID=676200 RepID=UPI000781DFAD|nr:GNAT family acetyltransferase [Demequina aurantiaca]
MTPSIRAFLPTDADAVAELWRAAFPNDPARNEPSAMIERKVARDPDLFWVAEANGIVVGVLMAGWDGVRGWLYHLAVADSHRRQGIATALVERAVNELKHLGCTKVNLQVRETNAGVIALYERLGWTEDRTMSLGRQLH